VLKNQLRLFERRYPVLRYHGAALPRTARRFAFFGTTALAISILVPVGIGLWSRGVVPWFRARLERAIGRQVRMDSLAIGGWRVLVARGVEIFGAPPFDAEPI